MTSRKFEHNIGIKSRTFIRSIGPFFLCFLARIIRGLSQETVQMSVMEESAVGTTVGSLFALPNYSYTWQEPTSMFDISTSGTVRTLQIIDREALPNHVFRLSVTGHPNSLLHPVMGRKDSLQESRLTLNVVITVLDINDNIPVFHVDTSREAISFYENVREGRKSITTATDPDAGVNGTIGRYDIVSGNDAGMFDLDFSGLPFILYITKRGTVSFDREMKDWYQLNISACDNGTPPKYGFLLVDVAILDVNDNTPKFGFSEYIIHVNESTPVGTSVFRAIATDSDLSFNGEIIYRLEDETHQFRIDENTGVIDTLISPLSCSRRCERSLVKCTPNSCFVPIEASDKGMTALSGRAYLYINVLDENDHDPTITFTKDASAISWVSVGENTSIQTGVFSITVGDKDNGANGETTLRIIHGNEEGYFFHLSLPTYGFNEVQVARQLDRETTARFNLTFEAVDKGSPPRSSRNSIIIIVTDANDHAPEFDYETYTVSLSEYTKPHSYVAYLRATDKDEGVNSKLTYGIISGNEGHKWFTVDAYTGLVTTTDSLDHEEFSRVVLNVTAHDSGTDPKYSYSSLIIDILDENDHIPKFYRATYFQKLIENSAPGTEIITIETIDLDPGDNGKVEYFIHQDTETRHPRTFSVHSKTGKVTALQSFDREVISEYTIKVVAKDMGSSPLSATATIQLIIKDANDNPPKFSSSQYYVNLIANDTKRLQITQVSATDKDSGVFGKVKYSFAESYNSFTINADSGLVSRTGHLTPHKHRLIVRARDGGGIYAVNDVVVNVIVINNSSSAPVFTRSWYDFKIPEDNGHLKSYISRSVGRVVALSMSGRTVTYVIVGGDPEGVFRIDSSLGTITTNLVVDREERAEYNLTVLAFDGETVNSTSVLVKILDLNDNVPIFSCDTTELTVLENWPVGTNVFLAQATDADTANNQDIKYSLTSTDDTSGVFAIENNTGVLYLAKPPNLLSHNFIQLIITATDAGTMQMSTSLAVKARIEDVNNHSPVFHKNGYELFIIESQPVNVVVMMLVASDSDKGRNSELSYKIIRGNQDMRFGLFPDGSLFIAHELDRENKDMYVLTIVVADSGDEPRSSSVNITIYVQDANDNSPVFTEEFYEFSVMENNRPDSFIGAVRATDADAGHNSEIVYSLVSDDMHCVLDPLLGTIYSKKQLDREQLVKSTKNSYFILDVLATDNGLKKRQSKVSVKVHVEDENDNPPVFIQASGTNIYVNEHSGVHDVVFTVLATDADEHVNAAVSYSIVSGNDRGKFGIHPTRGQLFIVEKLDREIEEQYPLKIKATDGGADVQLETFISLQAYVVDYNDNVPEFAADTQTYILVSEKTSADDILTTFSGSDRDLGNNGKLRYDIVSGNEHSIFSLDVYSGELSLAQTLDFESLKISNDAYILNITLSDSGFPALSVAILCTVKVIDENDNAPEFTDGLVTIYTKENTPRGSKIADLAAVDRDSSDHGRIRYTVFKQTPGGDYFAINEVTGEITVNIQLDREKVDVFKVIINAVDQSDVQSQRRTAEKSLTIFVEDVNDNCPVFQSPNLYLIPHSSSVGSTVGFLWATDIDHSDNDKVYYSFSGHKSHFFGLDSYTGRIFLMRSLPVDSFNHTLTVTASDGGKDGSCGAKPTTISILILVYSSNRSRPSFIRSNPASGSIQENVTAGTRIIQMTLISSSLSSRVEYYITNVAVSDRVYGGLLSIDRYSGVISTAANVDREMLPGDVLFVNVTAVEVVSTGLYAGYTQVTIKIEDQNDNAPVFSSSLFDASVSENILPGTVVTWIHVADPDITGHVVLSLTGPDSNKFRIEQNGTLLLTQHLDYETKQIHNFSVEANDGVTKSTALVYISVIDENDQAPVFSQPFYTFDISEDAEIGSTINSIAASDADSGSNSHVIYEYLSEWGQDYFHLKASSGTFTLKKVLDFEERQLFVLRVSARDGGTQPRSTEVKVYMNVKDVNDNPPEFDHVSYQKKISEDALVGTLVINVSATDQDSGLNGNVRYSIVGDSSSTFGIGPINGSIFTTGKLDREMMPVHSVIVMATDQASNVKDRMSATTTVEIKLIDANDSPPLFLSPTLTEVKEDAAVGSRVFTIVAADSDTGINSVISFKLVFHSTPHDVFSINPTSGEVLLRSPLDREAVSKYTLVIEAKDEGASPKVVQQTLVIQVIDANDNAPTFNQKEYKKVVSEDVAIGTSLLRIQARDLDEDLNEAVTYFIIGGDGSKDFHLDMSSGELRVQKYLDYERRKSYSLIVQAEDGSIESPLHSNVTLDITVLDVNDCVPVFDHCPYKTFAQEGMADGPVHVVTITARDEDSGDNGQLQYTLRDISNYNNLFEVDSVTGQIFVLRTMDRERTPYYVLTLVATDRGTPSLMGTATVTVYVMDINDHSPVFDSRGQYQVHVLENKPSGTQVVTVSVTDIDEGINSEIVYNLADNADNLFTILSKSGLVMTAASLDREMQSRYTLTVVAIDKGIPPRSSSAEVVIMVEDDNDHAPEFEAKSYTAIVNGCSNTADFVLGVTAVDQDTGNNGRITYSLEDDGKSYFKIDPETGVITTAKPLPRTNSRFTFSVRASDQGKFPLNSTATVVVKLFNTSATNCLRFRDFTSTLKIQENSEIGSAVTTIQATTTTKGSHVTYHIAAGNINKAFTIHPGSGVITVAGMVDYELTREFHLWVEVRGQSSSQLSSFKELIIEVLDENDNPPLFSSSSFPAEIEENCHAGSSVIQITAVDLDSGDNQRIYYNITSGNENNTFTINSSSGLVTTVSPNVDREKIAIFHLLIEAFDMGFPKRSAATTLNIAIKDKNDNQPTFIGPRSVAVPEDLPRNSIIMQLTTRDLDIGDNAQVTFSFENAADSSLPFAVDANSGVITNVQQLDAETQQRYSLSVTATDGSFIQKTTVIIKILDVNDNRPLFQNTVLVFNFTELQPPKTKVAHLTALDLDKSSANNKFFFSLKRPSSLFELNSVTGEVIALKTMHFLSGQKSGGHSINDYNMDILVTDHGVPSLSSIATLVIRICDANDHAPVFQSNDYFSPVPETVPIFKTIIHVFAEDKMDFGKNADIIYEVVGGNGMSFFSIAQTSGDVYPKVSLKGKVNQKFSLVVQARDNGLPVMSSTAVVELYITEVNLSPPKFNNIHFHKQVSEDVSEGYIIDIITATDNDQGLNGEIFFNITAGNGGNAFSIGVNDGVLQVLGKLDYETKTSHRISITARDKALFYKETTRDYTISILDVNDNKPIFDQEYHEAYINENSEPNSPVLRVSATDADTHESNTDICYSIIGDTDSKKFFKINEKTGDITSTDIVFDFEQRSLYTLHVMTFNPLRGSCTSAGWSSVTTVFVHIIGENEYAPEFIQENYSFVISEAAEVGLILGHIKAVDGDGAIDGVVHYYLEGDSNLMGVIVEPVTGAIRVSKRLDFESSPDISLTVIAKNWGSVMGNDTDTCTVNITVIDANDPAEFTRDVYQGNVSELSRGDTYVITVCAEDQDSRPEFRDFFYEIISGNEHGQFRVDPSGRIETTGRGLLDREMKPVHTLVLGARDTRDPVILGTCTVEIELMDVNDNGPRLSPEDIRVNVTENETIGQEIIVLKDHIMDYDLPPNQGPYNYKTLPGPWTDFFSLDEVTGLVVTKQVLKKDTHPSFVISLVVTDNGIPRMSSTLSFTVTVNDVIRPQTRSLKIIVSHLENYRRFDRIADISPLYPASRSRFSCRIIDGNDSPFFISEDCSLEVVGYLPSSVYHLKVQGLDNKLPPVEYNVTVVVETITNKTLASSVAVVLKGENISRFLEKKYVIFTRQVEEAFGKSFYCKIFSLKLVNGCLYVMMFIHDAGKRLLSSQDIERGLTSAKGIVEATADVKIQTVTASVCDNSPCQNGGKCSTKISLTGGTSIFESSNLVINVPNCDLEASCFCTSAYTGEYCQHSLQLCGTDYCSNGGICVNGSCQCPTQWEGRYCEMDVNECQARSPCKNGATCQNTNGLFQCHCYQGYHGPLCDSQNFCFSRPCSEHGTCIELSDSFKCICDYGYHGSTCQFSSVSFDKGSYAQFRPVDNNHISSVTMYFATVETNALLLFSPTTTEGVEKGFTAIEVVNSKVKASFLLEPAKKRHTARVVSLSTKDHVNSGVWHRLDYVASFGTASLIVQRCHGSECDPCSDHRAECYSQTTYQSHKYSTQVQYISIGGVRDFTHILEQSGRVSTHDFRGCLHSVSINGHQLVMDGTDVGDNSPEHIHGVSYTCPRTHSSDLCSEKDQVCYNSGVCVDMWSHVQCSCSSDYMDDFCLTKKQPFSLGQNAEIKYTLRPSYVRDKKLSEFIPETSRKRRFFGDSSMTLRFRTQSEEGVLLSARTESVRCVIWLTENQVHLVLASNHSVVEPLSVGAVAVSDGSWHNVSVTGSGTVWTLDLDGQSSGHRELGLSFDFESLDIVEIAVGGQASVFDYQDMHGFSGCISQFLINGESIPLNGSSEKYDIKLSGEVEGACSALCENNPCGEDNCVVEGEGYLCLLVAVKSTGLQNGLLLAVVFIIFFITSVIVIFVLFHTQRDLFHGCVHRKKQRQGSSGHAGTRRTNRSDIIIAGDRDNFASLHPLHLRNEEMIIQKLISKNLTREKTSLDSAYQGLTGFIRSPENALLPNETPMLEIENVNSLLREIDVPQSYNSEPACCTAHSDIGSSKTTGYFFHPDHYHHHHHRHQHYHQYQQPPVLNTRLLNKHKYIPVSLGANNCRTISSTYLLDTRHLRQGSIAETAPCVISNNNLVRSNSYGCPSSLLDDADQPEELCTCRSPLTIMHALKPRTHSYNLMSRYRSISTPRKSLGIHHSHNTTPQVTRILDSNPHLQESHKLLDKKSSLACKSGNQKWLKVEDISRSGAHSEHIQQVTDRHVMPSPIDSIPALKKAHSLPQQTALHSLILLEPPETSSDESSSNDSFTCSDFEYDIDTTSGQDLDHRTIMLPKQTEVDQQNYDNDNYDNVPRLLNHKQSNMSNFDDPSFKVDSPLSTNVMPSGDSSTRFHHPFPGQYDLDALMSLVPNLNRLVDVFKDIGQLPDSGEQLENTARSDSDEYV